MPKISIIIPVYNAFYTLKECVKSILSQDFSDFEILLIDDGSTDESFSICEKFSVEDSRIFAIKRNNSGAASTRNFGMSIAKGDYFCFVDSDDTISDNCLSYMYTKATEFDADILMCGFNMINGDAVKRIFAKTGVFEGNEINKCIVEIKSKDLIDSPCNKLYKSEFIKNSGIKMPENEIFEDTDFNLNLLKFSPKFVVCDKCFYNYILHMGSTTRKYNPNKLEIIKKRARLLSDVTIGVEDYCSYYFIKSVFSSIMDMFFAFDKKDIKTVIKKEIFTDEFKYKAKNAYFGGNFAKVIIFVARSKNVSLVYAFCKLSYILKYKYQKLFLRVK